MVLISLKAFLLFSDTLQLQLNFQGYSIRLIFSYRQNRNIGLPKVESSLMCFVILQQKLLEKA